MSDHALPDDETMYRALVEKDPAFEGLFFTGVTTTGVFCRPTCTARKPRRDHVVFFATTHDALLAGYRPCRVCRPVEPPAATPPGVRELLAEVEADPSLRLKDQDLRARGLDPAALRRWCRKHHGLTFQGYLRALRLGAAFGRLQEGETATNAAFDHGFESTSGFAAAFQKLLGASPSRATGAVIKVARVETPLGPMLAGASDRGLCLLEFVDRRMPEARRSRAASSIETQLVRLNRRLRATLVPGSSPHHDAIAQELARYFAGELRAFTVPLDLRGTPFQERVWAVLRTIPYGATRSYAEQARAIGAPTATRAVARANGDNRVAIVVPCHRVVGADGTLTGYGGGLWRKRWLLDHERRHA